MLDFSFAEIALIVVVAVVFIGPKELPVVVKALAKAMQTMRGLMREVRSGFDELTQETGIKDIQQDLHMIKGEDGKFYEAYDMTKLPQKTADNE